MKCFFDFFSNTDAAGTPLNEALSPDKSIYLERSFTVRFRCLLDNTSGFLRLDIRGRVKILHGQNRKTEEPRKYSLKHQILYLWNWLP